MDLKAAPRWREPIWKGFFGLALSPLPFALSTLTALLVAPCSSASAQRPTNVPRIGFLAASPLSAIAGAHRGIPPGAA